jgi:CRISPR/Cas system type I-B associated protein Csh2 (Cas7 group RAMP superfamily)
MIKQSQIGCVAVLVDMANPNGNTETGEPRTLDDGRGWASPFCIKHHLRSMLADHASPEFKELCDRLEIGRADRDRFFIFESPKKGYDEMSAKEAVETALSLSPEDICKRFWDVRLYGTTALEGKDNDGEDGKKAEKRKRGDKGRFIRTGCVQVSPFVSLRPVEVIVDSLTKKSPLEADKIESGESTFGSNAIRLVKHGLYFGNYRVSAAESDKTMATDLDVTVLKNLIPLLFTRRAAQRVCVDVVMAFHAVHSNVLGSFNEQQFIQACTPVVISAGDPASLSDYRIPTLDSVREAMKNAKVERIEDLMRV